MNIKLRPWTERDLPNLVKYGNNIKIFNNLTDSFPHPYTLEWAEKFLAMQRTENGPFIRAIDLDGEAIGTLGLHAQTDIYRMNRELGYWLAEPFWGKGIMTQAVVLMTSLGFQELEVHRIFARPFGRNIASQKILEKAGYKQDAFIKESFFKNGVYEDEWIYSVRRQEWLTEPV